MLNYTLVWTLKHVPAHNYLCASMMGQSQRLASQYA